MNHFIFPSAKHKCSNLSTSSLTYIFKPVCGKGYCISVLICISLKTNDVEHLFITLFIFIKRLLGPSLAHFSKSSPSSSRFCTCFLSLTSCSSLNGPCYVIFSAWHTFAYLSSDNCWRLISALNSWDMSLTSGLVFSPVNHDISRSLILSSFYAVL